MPETAGRQPDAVIACVGGGSNAMGIFHPYIPTPRRAARSASRRRARASRPAGMRRRCRAGSPACCTATHLPAAGRERPDHRDAFDLGRPRLSRRRPRARVAEGQRPRRVRRRSPTTRRSRRSTSCCRIEGIIPALESSHAVAYAMKLAPTLPKRQRSCSSTCPAAATRTCTRSPSAQSASSTSCDEPHRRHVRRAARAPGARR